MSPGGASNLAASLGPAWDGDWWLDDVDVPIFTLLEGRLRPRFNLLKAVRFAHVSK